MVYSSINVSLVCLLRSHYIKHSRECLSTFLNILKFFKNTPRAMHHIFSSLLGILKCGQTLSFVFDLAGILHQNNIFRQYTCCVFNIMAYFLQCICIDNMHLTSSISAMLPTTCTVTKTMQLRLHNKAIFNSSEFMNDTLVTNGFSIVSSCRNKPTWHIIC